jgi:hypothetical protein
MVGIVGILLLGSLAWSAVGAMFSALGQATAVLTTGRPTPTRLAAPAAVTPQPAQLTGTPPSGAATRAVATPVSGAATRAVTTPAPGAGSAQGTTPSGQDAAGAGDTPVATATATPGLEATSEPTLAAPATPNASGRPPWVLLPQPAPDGHVAPGALTVEARARGDAPITAIRLELDGAALAVSLEQRSGDTWRGSASAQVAAGKHAVRATVVDDQGRSGSFRWSFVAGP